MRSWRSWRGGPAWVVAVIAAVGSVVYAVQLEDRTEVASGAPGAMGACCLIDESCTEITEAECNSIPYGGVYQGDGTLCSAITCPEVEGMGSCCFPFGFCGCCMSEAVCLLSGGVFVGAVLCDDVECPPRAACCLPDGGCVVTLQPECEFAGGIFMGITSLCSEVPCAGACCVMNFECSTMTEQECLGIGADFLGDGTVCIFEPCVTFGACCLPSGLCEVTSETECVVERNGTFFANLACPVALDSATLGGTQSIGLEGDPDNFLYFVDVALQAGFPGTPVRLLGIGWDLDVQTICPGWLADIRIGLGDDAGDNTYVLAPGVGFNYCTTQHLAGSQSIDLVLTDGALAVEFFEDYDDRTDLPDAVYLAGSELRYVYEIPCVPARVHNETQDTYHQTIQQAIGLADTNDELIASPGVYYEVVDFLGKRLTLRSQSGDPADTIIDASHIGTAVTMGPGADGTLRGFTLTNADVSEGAVGGDGSGVLIDGSSPLIDNCVITANNGVNGGAMRVREGGSPTIYRTRFLDNNAFEDGGALHLADAGSSAMVLASVFEGNMAENGGAVYLATDTLATLKRNIFRYNYTSVDGSAVLNRGAEVFLSSCLLHGNSSSTSPADATHSAALDNRLGGEMIVVNCTIAHNIGVVVGGYYASGSTTQLINSIIWGNDPPMQMSITGGTTEMAYCDVQGGAPLPNFFGFDEDPLFIDPPNDYRLNLGSPCVNTGGMGYPDVCLPECESPVYYPPRNCRDLDEDTRIRTCRVDLGAYESPFFVDCNDNGHADACDISPVFGFLCTADLTLGDLPGSATAFTVSPNSLTIQGNNNGSPGPSVAWAGMTLDATGGWFQFHVSYDSDDSDCSTGSWDYPVFLLNGDTYGLNHDGTLVDANELTCEAAGTIDNGDPGARTFNVQLDHMTGIGPYDIGIGVVSVDNSGGAGEVTFSGFRSFDDANINGRPDECDCPYDVDGDDEAGFSDILEIIINWGPCSIVGPCPPDVNENGEVDFADILEVIVNWGPCFLPA